MDDKTKQAARSLVECEITAGDPETLAWLRALLPRINQRVAAYIVSGVERRLLGSKQIGDFPQ